MRRYFLVCIPAILFSCSTEDKPDPLPKPAQNTMQGIFVDSPVSGLKYETETHSGFTDENGKYNYEEGETVTFYIGDIKLGSAEASEELTPISITSTSDATLETLEVQNIAALLQTLDLDGDATNGITIDEEVVNALSISEIDFSKSIVQILGEIALEIFQKTNVELKVVYPEIAALHLAQTLGLEFEPKATFTLNFLPTFTNYYSRDNTAVNWVHEFDEQGRLVKSRKYEKYPSRIIAEYHLSDYDEVSNLARIDINHYDYSRYPFGHQFTYKLEIDDEFFFRGTIIAHQDRNSENRINFIDYTELGWVKKVESKYNRAEGQTNINITEYDYTEKGFVVKMKKYNEANDLISSFQRTQTDFGEIKTETSEMSYIEKFYRIDNTLEKVEVYRDLGDIKFETIYEYDDLEVLKSIITNMDDGDKRISHYEEGYLVYSIEFKSGLIERKIFYSLGEEHYIKVKEEYYDDNGELKYTVYYDQSGNVTDTIYE
ncbi:hypothetical protein ML462_13840 [Gramella lutea]|uniref:Uncharacterized protein n=1 Tax=Christiangramia lutea TaxID=1607951 RepID=A0A9X1V4Z0_9FLAO|nr:hypothetical protein [Christiangramia lutea]MCH4824254.1 hypothetical protein [Christiangramia lutea]